MSPQPRAAIYARFSSDLQSDASIDDQIRTAKELAQGHGWQVSDALIYTDHAMSGASMMRPGIQMLMLDAQAGKFDVVIAEALDRISRDPQCIRQRLVAKHDQRQRAARHGHPDQRDLYRSSDLEPNTEGEEP